MAVDDVKRHLAEFGLDGRVREFDTSSATVELAAQAVGTEPRRIAKTLSFLVDGRAVLIVAAGDARIDNPKFKAIFHAKAKMLTPDQAIEMVGHAVGGVCPFALPPGVSVYLDESLRRFDTVFPAAGSAASAVPARSTSASRTAANCLKIRFIISSSRVFLAVNMARKSKKRLRKSRRNSLVKKCDRPRCRTLQTRPDRFYPVRIEISKC